MQGRAGRVTGGLTRAARTGLIVGLMGISCAPGTRTAVGSSIVDEAKHDRPEVRRTGQVTTVAPTEGQQVDVPGTELTVAVKAVRDFTSEGCLGGPVGCRDHAEVEVTRGGNSQAVVLYVARTDAERTRGVEQARVFGYRIVLTALHGKRITLSVEKEP